MVENNCLSAIKDWDKKLKLIKEENSENSTNEIVLELEDTVDTYKIDALKTFLEIASKLSDKLNGFWYCSNSRKIDNVAGIQKATLKFMKLDKYVARQQRYLENIDLDTLADSNLDDLAMATNVFACLEKGVFYESTRPSSFLQNDLCPRHLANSEKFIRYAEKLSNYVTLNKSNKLL